MLTKSSKASIEKKETMVGVWYTIAAYATWGILPLYWKALKHISPQEILAHRILWSFVFMMGLISVTRQWGDLSRTLKDRKKLIYICLSSLVLCANWYIYIWAVNTEKVVQASLGYYINPLISVVLGVIILKERLNLWQIISFIIAFAGVMVLNIGLHVVPWVSLALALSFGLYGLFKKMAGVNSLMGLFLETGFVMPAALLYLVSKKFSLVGLSRETFIPTLLLVLGSGAATSAPLIFFANGVRRIPLSMVGFLQYLSPSLNLILGVLVFKEEFTTIHYISFGLIWFALLIYTLSQTKAVKLFQSEKQCTDS